MPVKLVVKDITVAYGRHQATVTRAKGALRLQLLVDQKAAQAWAAAVQQTPIMVWWPKDQVQHTQREQRQALRKQYERAAAGALYPLPQVVRWGRSVLADVEAISRDPWFD